jgi:hypothetical protein
MQLEEGNVMSQIPLIATIDLGKDFSSQFKKDILREINKRLSSVLPAAVRQIKEKLQDSIRVRIMASPEYAAISGGRFRGELGLPDGATRINAIIERWAESISVTYRKGTGVNLGSIDIGILQDSWEDVLAMGEAVLTYSSRKGSKSLEWLRWLLKEGNAVIVSQYDFSPKSSTSSRTGLGIMIKKRGGGWKVPPQYAGTEEDNFATRALADIASDIDIVVRRELTKVM